MRTAPATTRRTRSGGRGAAEAGKAEGEDCGDGVEVGGCCAGTGVVGAGGAVAGPVADDLASGQRCYAILVAAVRGTHAQIHSGGSGSRRRTAQRHCRGPMMAMLIMLLPLPLLLLLLPPRRSLCRPTRTARPCPARPEETYNRRDEANPPLRDCTAVG
jgi:hypothetical protein